MKKKSRIFCCSILLMVCQVAVSSSAVLAEERTDFTGVSEHCEEIKGILKNVQREDSKIRVYLGSYYEKILTKYVTRLNLRLVENNLSQTGLIEGQAGLATARTKFVEDFVRYQQGLEELLTMNCKDEPERFYRELEKVRKERIEVRKDSAEIESLISKHQKMVGELRTKLGGKNATQTNEVEGEI